MAQQYDASLKVLFQQSRGLVARSLFGVPVAEWLNVELPMVRTRGRTCWRAAATAACGTWNWNRGTARTSGGVWPDTTSDSIAC